MFTSISPVMLLLAVLALCSTTLGIAAAIKQPPQHTVSGYTMSDSIPMEYFFVDDTNGTGTHYIYPSAYVKSMLEGSKKYIAKLEKQLPAESLASISEATVTRMKIHKNDWIYLALMKHAGSVAGKQVVVIGSSEPRIETIALAFGASSVTTVEYNRLTYGDGIEFPIQTVSADEFQDFYRQNHESVDVVISISSIEHDGLGRYGDPLNTEADLKAMQQVRRLLKPDGLFFLSVPVGPDVTVFNLHRRYGVKRLPLLLQSYEVIDRIPWNEEKLTRAANWRQTYEPVFVLRKSANEEVSIDNAGPAGGEEQLAVGNEEEF